MPTSASASMLIQVQAAVVGSSPVLGTLQGDMSNGATGARWTQGTGSGNIDRVFRKNYTIAAAGTQSFNTLAAGSLTDIHAQAIDLDEIKGLMIKCVTGAIKVDAPATGFMGFFGSATDFIVLAAGQTLALEFGATGLDVTTNSKFDLIDTAGGSGSTVEVAFFGAQ